MIKNIFVSLLLVVFVFALAIPAYTQESAKKPMVMKSVSCNPDCGFMCRSHDEKELSAIVIDHAHNAHGKTIAEKDVKSMMKTEPMAPKMEKKPMMKKG